MNQLVKASSASGVTRRASSRLMRHLPSAAPNSYVPGAWGLTAELQLPTSRN